NEPRELRPVRGELRLGEPLAEVLESLFLESGLRVDGGEPFGGERQRVHVCDLDQDGNHAPGGATTGWAGTVPRAAHGGNRDGGVTGWPYLAPGEHTGGARPHARPGAAST